MRTAKKILIVVCLLFSLAGMLYASGVIERLSASYKEQNGRVEIGWRSVDESDVASYEIWRASVRDDFFRIVGTLDHQNLKGNGKDYVFYDEGVFKTTNAFKYKVRIVLQNGSTFDSPVVTTSVVSSTVKRTWGSIKAMFR
ncbi:MAG: hypothetical protein V1799_02305 [bacterium]